MQPPQQEQSTNTNDKTAIAQIAMATAVDYHNSRTNIVSINSTQRQDLLKDYSQVGIALLGGSLTVLTIGTNVVKMPPILYVGSAVVLLGVVMAFIVRHKLLTFMRDRLASEAKIYFKVVNPARDVLIDPSNIIAREKLIDALQAPITNPQLGWLGEWGDRLVGATLLLGGLLVVASLLFHVTI